MIMPNKCNYICSGFYNENILKIGFNDVDCISNKLLDTYISNIFLDELPKYY